jgi:hypothetical protein
MSIGEVKEHLVKAKQGIEELGADLDRLIAGIEKQGGELPAPRKRAEPRQPRVRGRVSMSQAVMDVLREAGEPLKAETIVERAFAMGAETEAERPGEAIDLLLYKARSKGKPVDRVEGQVRTWRWVGDAGSQS